MNHKIFIIAIILMVVIPFIQSGSGSVATLGSYKHSLLKDYLYNSEIDALWILNEGRQDYRLYFYGDTLIVIKGQESYDEYWRGDTCITEHFWVELEKEVWIKQKGGLK